MRNETKTNKFRPLWRMFVGAGLLCGGGMVLAAVGASAHPGHHRGGDHARNPEARMTRHLERLTQELTLNADQVSMVRGILQEHIATRREAGERRRAARHEGRAALRHALEGVLTPEQLVRFDEMRQRRGERRLDRRLERMTTLLDLSDVQVQRVREIFESVRARHQPPVEASAETRRLQHREIRREVRSALAEVLTEEQLASLRQHRRHHRSGPVRR